MEEWQRPAVGLLRSPGLRRAFEMDRESDRVRTSFGRHLFGQGCLLARRLLEAGVAFVTDYWHYEGPDDSPVWETHGNNFKHLRERLMPLSDQALAALLADLAARGLLDDTLVLCFGEFGRTPRVNKNAGRDHWPYVQSVVLAGAGVRGGSVYGASDRRGLPGRPASDARRPRRDRAASARGAAGPGADRPAGQAATGPLWAAGARCVEVTGSATARPRISRHDRGRAVAGRSGDSVLLCASMRSERAMSSGGTHSRCEDQTAGFFAASVSQPREKRASVIVS